MPRLTRSRSEAQAQVRSGLERPSACAFGCGLNEAAAVPGFVQSAHHTAKLMIELARLPALDESP